MTIERGSSPPRHAVVDVEKKKEKKSCDNRKWKAILACQLCTDPGRDSRQGLNAILLMRWVGVLFSPQREMQEGTCHEVHAQIN
jgi:hypothetical protein